MKIDLLIDGQWGSTGKGKLAHYLMSNGAYEAAFCDFSANAGHTAYHPVCEDIREKVVMHHLPMAACFPDIPIFLGPGCVIDAEILTKEIERHECANRVAIHPNAVIIQSRHKTQEQVTTRHIASTQQGVGEATAEKIMRKDDTILVRNYLPFQDYRTRWAREFPKLLDSRAVCLGETAQGVDLSVDSAFYPYTTSRNVNPAACLDRMGAIHPSHLREVFLSLRTYPIRVGNIPATEDQKEGYSGPVYPGQLELDWEDFGIEPEITTTTKRPRRIFQWSDDQFEHALRATHPDVVFFNFINYLDPDCTSTNEVEGLSEDAGEWLHNRMRVMGDVFARIGIPRPFVLLGTGPYLDDMIEVEIL